jgi:TRAP-type C4-dicarboxylate transport system permease small subunit
MMIWLGIAKVQQQAATFQKTIILEIPLELVFAILPLMGIMMGIRTIQNMVLDYQQIKSGKSST